jgi:hypothetical protein
MTQSMALPGSGDEMTRLPRTIRLDPSDTFIFERAAEPAEWAVSGSFAFLDREPSMLTRKEKTALRSGFLGLSSFGWSTLCVVVEASAKEREGAVEQLAAHLLEAYGAPSLELALQAAEEELSFAESLCQHPLQTILAVQREVEDTGEIRERFRTLHARDTSADPDPLHANLRAFTMVEDSDAPEDGVDLQGFLKTDRT